MNGISVIINKVPDLFGKLGDLTMVSRDWVWVFFLFYLFINLPGYCRLGKESDSDLTAEIEMVDQSVFVGTCSGRHVERFQKKVSLLFLRKYP